jgi:nucleotide-binding universal stress UspA family protein
MVTVWPDGPRDEGTGRPAAAEGEDDARGRMRADAAELAALAGCAEVPVQAQVRYGQPAENLVDTLGRAGLLVVGSRGRGSVHGALLGSVSQQCAQYARGSVVVVRNDISAHGAALWTGAASRVVVGVDGSAGSLVALRLAAEEARLRGGELHVVHAWTDRWRGYGGFPWSLSTAGMREQAHVTVEQSLRAGRVQEAVGVRIRAEAIEGVEWDVLSEVAEAADLLVVGSRGRTGWAGLLLGSVGLRVLSHAPCPVVVARPSTAEG